MASSHTFNTQPARCCDEQGARGFQPPFAGGYEGSGTAVPVHHRGYRLPAKQPPQHGSNDMFVGRNPTRSAGSERQVRLDLCRGSSRQGQPHRCCIYRTVVRAQPLTKKLHLADYLGSRLPKPPNPPLFLAAFLAGALLAAFFAVFLTVFLAAFFALAIIHLGLNLRPSLQPCCNVRAKGARDQGISEVQAHIGEYLRGARGGAEARGDWQLAA
jgi:hypothetical protein